MFSRTAQSATMPLVRRGRGTSASGVSPGVGGRRSGSRVPALVWGMCRASQTCVCSQCLSSVRRAGIDGSAFRVPVVEMWYSVVTSCGDAGRRHPTLWLSVNLNQRRFGAEADDVSESGGRVVGLGFVAGLDRLFPGRLREDCVYEGCV